MPALFGPHYRCPGMADRRISAPQSESLKRNPPVAKNTCPVNCGGRPVDTKIGNFFRLGIPEDSLILGSITGSALTPVIPLRPPYLVFDSGTRTSP